MAAPITFTASIIPGAGRGKKLGSPTFNLDLHSVPEELSDGVYAVRARVEEVQLPSVMHFGPRPTFDGSRSCEVHLLGEIPSTKHQAPKAITVEVIEKLRDVKRFESPEALQVQIAEDIRRAKEIHSLLH